MSSNRLDLEATVGEVEDQHQHHSRRESHQRHDTAKKELSRSYSHGRRSNEDRRKSIQMHSSSHERRRSGDCRPPQRRRSTDERSSQSDRLRSSRHKSSSSSRHKYASRSTSNSSDSILSMAEADEDTKPERRISRGKSHRRRRSRDRDDALSSNESNGATDTLYGEDEEAKAKSKTSRGSSERAVTPGVEHVGSKSNRTTSTLYGNDADAKTKAKALMRAATPGVERVASKSNRTINTLYGNDADAKAKAMRGSSKRSLNPGMEQHSNHSAATSTLYGSDADAKAKARGSSKRSLNPGMKQYTNHSAAVSTLYGSDADAKAKAKAARGAPTTNPVAGRVISGLDSTGRTHNNAATITEAKDAARVPNAPESDPRSGTSRTSGQEEGVDDEPEKKEKRKKRIVLLFLLLFLIGGGVAVWYFLFRNESDGGGNSQIKNSNVLQEVPTASPSTPVETNAQPVAPTTMGSDTAFPSAPPSQYYIYEPPSKSDCQAIATNQTVAGRDTMVNSDFEIGVEVVLSESFTMSETVLSDLLDAIQEKILPSLAGCFIDIDELVERWRYVIFDAFVTGNVLPDESCTDEMLAAQNCHQVSVKLDLFLKGYARVIDIISLITAEEENVANHLGLSDPFLIVKLIEAKSLIPTAAPTRMPSDAPSFSPTHSPTVEASSNPTSLPSVELSKRPTEDPTISPTPMPTSEQSMMPTTASPTGNPSVEPSRVPSQSPSARPTSLTTGTPTLLPTSDPSSRPTLSPSKSPTITPSSSPTMRPTDEPSSIPSNNPTKPPTVAPSQIPTVSPSKNPTDNNPSTLPTQFQSFSPSPAPTSATEKITQAYGPYTNYPVSQSTISHGGVAIRAIDGNNSGYWPDGSMTHTNNNADQWWEVDLATGAGRPVAVKYITVWNRIDCCSDRLIGAVVQLLDASKNDITPPGVANVLSDVQETMIDFGVVLDVSFVKISKDGFIVLAEVEIFGYVP